jgi:hypothetical protein
VNVGADNPTFWGESDPEVRTIANQLGVSLEERDAIFGLTQIAGGALVTAYPALYARIDPEPAPPMAGLFVRETELRLVRVVPYIEGAPVHPKWDTDVGAEDGGMR